MRCRRAATIAVRVAKLHWPCRGPSQTAWGRVVQAIHPRHRSFACSALPYRPKGPIRFAPSLRRKHHHPPPLSQLPPLMRSPPEHQHLLNGTSFPVPMDDVAWNAEKEAQRRDRTQTDGPHSVNGQSSRQQVASGSDTEMGAEILSIPHEKYSSRPTKVPHAVCEGPRHGQCSLATRTAMVAALQHRIGKLLSY